MTGLGEVIAVVAVGEDGWGGEEMVERGVRGEILMDVAACCGCAPGEGPICAGWPGEVIPSPDLSWFGAWDWERFRLAKVLSSAVVAWLSKLSREGSWM